MPQSEYDKWLGETPATTEIPAPEASLPAASYDEWLEGTDSATTKEREQNAILAIKPDLTTEKPKYFSLDAKGQPVEDERGLYLLDSSGLPQPVLRDIPQRSFWGMLKDSFKSNYHEMEKAGVQGKRLYGIDVDEKYAKSLDDFKPPQAVPGGSESETPEYVAASVGMLAGSTAYAMKSGFTLMRDAAMLDAPSLLKHATSEGTLPAAIFANAGADYKEMVGKGVDPEIAQNTARVTGVINGVLDNAELFTMLWGVAPEASAVKLAFKDKLLGAASRYLTAGGVESGTESLQQVVSEAGDALSIEMHNTLHPDTEVPQEELSQRISDVVETFKSTLTGTLAMGLPGIGTKVGMESMIQYANDPVRVLNQKVKKLSQDLGMPYQAEDAGPVVDEVKKQFLHEKEPQVDQWLKDIKAVRPEITDDQLGAMKQVTMRFFTQLPLDLVKDRFLDVRGPMPSATAVEPSDAAEQVLNQPALDVLGVKLEDTSLNPELVEHLRTKLAERDVPDDLKHLTVGQFQSMMTKLESLSIYSDPKYKLPAKEVLKRMGLWDEDNLSLKENWDAPIAKGLRDKLIQMPAVQEALAAPVKDSDGDLTTLDVVKGPDGKPLLVFHGTGQEETDFSDVSSSTVQGLVSFLREQQKLHSDNIYKPTPYAELIPQLEQVLRDMDTGKSFPWAVSRLPIEDHASIRSLLRDRRVSEAKISTGFKEFQPSRVGTFFSTSPNVSHGFSMVSGGAPRVVPAFLKGKLWDFRNPQDIDVVTEAGPLDAQHATVTRLIRGDWSTIESAEVQKRIRDAGYDGFITREGSAINYSVFDPKQIVPAFDPKKEGKQLFQNNLDKGGQQFLQTIGLGIVRPDGKIEIVKVDLSKGTSYPTHSEKFERPFSGDRFTVMKNGRIVWTDNWVPQDVKFSIENTIQREFGIPVKDHKELWGLYQQEGKAPPKAAIQFLRSRDAVFHLMENADISSIIHESSHFFFMFLPEADLKTIADWAKVDHDHLMKYVKDPFSLDLEESESATQAQEMFARGFEKYLRKGHSPIPQLQVIFEKFKQWLTAIYSSLKGSPIDIKLKPDVEAIFQRWLASDQDRREAYGEMWNPKTGQKYQIMKNSKGNKAVLVYKGKNALWVDVENIIKGHPPIAHQTKFLGKDITYMPPQSVLSLPSTPQAQLEEMYRRLPTMDKDELKLLAQRFNIEIPEKLKSKIGIALFLEQELRNYTQLLSPDQPHLGHEEEGLVTRLLRMDKGNPVYKIIRGAKKPGSVLVNMWAPDLIDYMEKRGGEYGKRLAQTALQATGKSKDVYGALRDDLNLLMQKLSIGHTREIYDLLRYVREGNAGTAKWQLAVEGKYDMRQLSDYQQDVVLLFKTLSDNLGLLMETGYVGKRKVLKGGILTFDPSMEVEKKDRKTGEMVKKRGAHKKFVAAQEGRVQRWSTTTLYDIMTSPNWRLRLQLAEVLAAMPDNGLKGPQGVKKAFAKLGGKKGLKVENINPQERLRTFKVFPSTMWLKDELGHEVRIDLLHSDIYDAANHMVLRASERLGFIHAFAEFDEKQGVYRNDKDLHSDILAEYSTAVGDPQTAKLAVHLLRSLQGMPVWGTNNPMLLPGSGPEQFTKFTMWSVALMRGLMLPLSVVWDFYQTLQLTLGSVGVRRYIKSLGVLMSRENRGEAMRQMSRIGAIALPHGKLYVDPRNLGYEIPRWLSVALLTPKRWQNEWNEIITSAAFMESIKDWRGRQDPSTGRVKRNILVTDRLVLKVLRFTDSQIAEILSGQASEELYNEVLQRAVPMTQSTNTMPAERSMFAHSRLYKSIVQYDSFYQNQSRVALRLASIVASGEVDSKASRAFIARNVSGLLVSGILGSLTYGFIRGGKDDWKEKGAEVKNLDGAVRFLMDSILFQVFGGPYIAFMRGMNREEQSWMQSVMGVSPITLFFDNWSSALAGKGYYQDMTFMDRVWTATKRSTTLTPAITHIAAIAGLGGEDMHRDRVVAAYWRWYNRNDDIEKSVTVRRNEEKEDRDFRIKMKKLYKQIKREGIHADTYQMMSEVVGYDPYLSEANAQRAIASLHSRRLLALDEYGEPHKPGLTMEDVEDLKKHIPEEYFNEILVHDDLLDQAAKELK